MLHKKQENKKDFRVFSIFSHTGFTVIASLLIGAFLGLALDHIFDILPMLFLLFSCLGMATAYIVIFFYRVERQRQKTDIKPDSENNPKERGD